MTSKFRFVVAALFLPDLGEHAGYGMFHVFVGKRHFDGGVHVMHIIFALTRLRREVRRAVGSLAEQKPCVGVKHGCLSRRVIAVESRVAAVKSVFGRADALKIFQFQS